MKNILFSDKTALIGLLLLQNLRFFAQTAGTVDSIKFAGGTTSVVYKKADEADDMAILLALNNHFSMSEEVKISVSQAPARLDPVPQKAEPLAAEPILIVEKVPNPTLQIQQKAEPKKPASTAKMASGSTQKAVAKTASKKANGKKSFAKPMSKKRFRWPSISLPSLGRDTSGRTGCYRF